MRNNLKLGVVLTIIGLAGTALFLAGAADFGNAAIYSSNPWLLVAGGACFVVLLVGMYYVRKSIKKTREERNRRW